jgi:hypothetical protein
MVSPLISVLSGRVGQVPIRILELQTAKEILAEIFGVGVSDVEEMILNRYEEACYGNSEPEEWLQELWVVE